MSDGYVKIVGAITQPVNTLIEKVSNAIGILYEPTHIKKIARADIEINKLKLLANIELSAIQKRAIQRTIHLETKRQENIEEVLELAANAITADACPEKINDDWLYKFFDHVKNISDSEFQMIWAKILSGESERPQTYSKKLLSNLSLMEKEDAILFKKLSQFCFKIRDEIYSYITNTSSGIYEEQGITYSNLLRLQSLGLVALTSGGLGGYVTKIEEENIDLFYMDKVIFVINRNKWDDGEYISETLGVGSCVLSREGAQLMSVTENISNQDFIPFLEDALPSKGYSLTKVKNTK